MWNVARKWAAPVDRPINRQISDLPLQSRPDGAREVWPVVSVWIKGRTDNGAPSHCRLVLSPFADRGTYRSFVYVLVTPHLEVFPWIQKVSNVHLDAAALHPADFA